MNEIQECEMDSKSTKRRPGTLTELEQSVSDLPMEIMDTSISRGSAEVDDTFIDSFQNLHIGTPLKVKVFCVSCFSSCPKERSSRPKTDATVLSKDNDCHPRF
ncbi:hypothetical protein Y1Q_0023004 [Alligator mississippiensis]|uniref:Uncharacterized protein n=1 Tax=Alligator mississippiensis TaxID=8496 RepID=A0A151P783_ALLMI|nr:hypothetical protein Y1Q_0023004 [Alligator mississippiensis]